VTNDINRKTDGIRATFRGINSGSSPDIIGKEYLAFGTNLTVRGGFPRCRPGYRKLAINYGANAALQDGLFQDAAYFKPRGGEPCLIASISGHLYKYSFGLSNTVSDISIIGDLNSAIQRQSWMLQAEDWLITANALQRPLFYDGVTMRRAGDDEMRTGTMMEYSKGRIWYARPDRQSFRAGDIAYGASGTQQYNYRDAILKDTENDFLNEQGEFSIPLDAGQITAIRNIAILDTSMGQGPLQVYAERGSFSINAPPDRTTWKDLTYPIATVSGIGNGPTSHFATININGDIWFRSRDGIRSFIIAVRQFNEWGNVPMSKEVNRIIEADDTKSLGQSSAILFDNRLLMTCSPANSVAHGTYHRGLIALDFDITSSMAERLPPAYDGLWTGIRVLKLLSGDFGGVDRAFAFVLSNEDKIELWEITRNSLFDNDVKPIEWTFETPALFDGFELRKLKGGEMFVDQLVGTVTFDVKYRPDQYAGWIDWHSWSECANYQTCTLADCAAPGNLKPQYRSKMLFPELPDEVCTLEDNRRANFGYLFQLRAAMSGPARIKALAAHVYPQLEQPQGECRGEGPCISSNVCDLPVFSYSAEL
jgi:hypothetical protein